MGKRKVTQQEVIDAYYRNFKQHSAAAKELGISRERVRQILDALGLKTETNLKKTTQVKELAAQDKTITEIARELNMTTRSVKLTVNLEKIEVVKKPHSNRKYTEEQLIELHGKFNGKYSEIAKYLGIPQPCVSRLYKDRGLREQCPSFYKSRNLIKD